jgi:glucan phosphoethanolaminetransferase (alkaline phosphatase superfamily)
MKIALSILFLVLAFIIPLFYDGILDFFVVNLKSGWVFGSIYIRLIVIILFTVFLYLLFSLFERTRKIKFIFVFLISLLPGFGISFIKPIYDIDYGMFDDSMEIETAALSEATNGDFQFAK